MDFDPTRLTADFGDPVREAIACRTTAALFDFSFMSRGVVTGPGAVNVIATLTRRQIADLPVGRIRYAVRETPNGYVVADLTVWRTGDQEWEVMSGRSVDIADLQAASCSAASCRAHARTVPPANVRDLSAQTRIYAVQGPQALNVLRPLLQPQEANRLAALTYYGCGDFLLAGIPVRIGRLGYTGERGFELIVAAADGAALWNKLAPRACPAGFIAADMLRIEAGFVLFANEFRVPVTSAESGLGNFAEATKGPYASRCIHSGLARPIRLVSFRALTNVCVTLFQPPSGVSRPNRNDELIVTSACNSIAAQSVLGLGYVLSERNPAAALQDSCGAISDIELVPRPYFDPEKRRPREPWN